MEKTLAKRMYITPTASVDAEVSLSEFSFREIVGYLQHHGYGVSGDGVDSGAQGLCDPEFDGLFLTPEDLSRIATLSLCGQKQPARDLVLGIVGDAIGRVL